MSKPEWWLKRKKSRPVKSLEEYLKGTPPVKHNTITTSFDLELLKSIYDIEENVVWREILVRRVGWQSTPGTGRVLTGASESEFLIKVAKKDSQPKIRKWASVYANNYGLFVWLGKNDPNKTNRKHAKRRIREYPISLRLMFEMDQENPLNGTQ